MVFRDHRPTNASAWSSACGFWRTASSVCPVPLAVSRGATSFDFSIQGGWLSGQISNNATCAGSDSYVTKPSADELLIDVWKALADGLWSSSVVFTVKVASTFGGTHQVLARASGTSNPSPVLLSKGGIPVSTGCPPDHFGTLTVFDDGTFTFV